jgi:hypothetical protein
MLALRSIDGDHRSTYNCTMLHQRLHDAPSSMRCCCIMDCTRLHRRYVVLQLTVASCTVNHVRRTINARTLDHHLLHDAPSTMRRSSISRCTMLHQPLHDATSRVALWSTDYTLVLRETCQPPWRRDNSSQRIKVFLTRTQCRVIRGQYVIE